MAGTVTAHTTSADSNNAPFSISITSQDPQEILSCAQTGNPADLEIRRIDFTNNGMQYVTFGKSSTWYPFENITADIQVRNNGNERVNDIDTYWGLWDTQNNQWVIEPDDIKTFNLNDGKTQDLSVDFKIDDRMDEDLSDLSDGNHYVFYVYAMGDRSNDSVSTCASDYKDASISIESDFVILNNIKIPDTVQCGQTVDVTADAWNIGDNDQDDVSVRLFSLDTGLNVSQSTNIGTIDAFDRKPISFSFTVPQGIDEKIYRLETQVYDDSGDVFQNSDDENSELVIPLQVSGGCTSASQISVAASIVSGGQAGKPLQVVSTITNNGNSQKTYAVSATGYSLWASSASADQGQITLASGQSAQVVFTFDVNGDAQGLQTFTINLISGSDVVTQPVSVTIQPGAGFLGLNGLSGNSWIWVIAGLNLILVIVIIIVAVRVSRRK